MFSDFTTKFKDLNINWVEDSSKEIYLLIVDRVYSNPVTYRNLEGDQNKECLQNLQNKILSEHMRDITWLVAVRRLAVRAVVKWSCFVKTSKCPMPKCDEEETLEHFLLECYRSKEVWDKMKTMGLKIEINMVSVFYGIFKEKLSKSKYDFLWYIMCLTKSKLWKTRCRMTIDKQFVSSDVVFKNIQTELKRKKSSKLSFKDQSVWDSIIL